MQIKSEELSHLASFILKAIVIVLVIIGLAGLSTKFPMYQRKKSTPKIKVTVVSPSKAKVKVLKVRQIKPGKTEIEYEIQGPEQKTREGFSYIPKKITFKSIVEYPDYNFTYGLGYYKTPNLTGSGLTRSWITVPFLDSYLTTGILVSKDREDKLLGALMFGLCREVMPHLAINVGWCFSVKYMGEGYVGMSYIW